MNLISKFTDILEESKEKYRESLISSSTFKMTEEINWDLPMEEKTDCSGNLPEGSGILAFGDNSRFMETLLTEKNMGGKIKLIYIDPPFFSKASYDSAITLYGEGGKKVSSIKLFAYEDKWQSDMAVYLTMLSHRLYLMKDLLAEDGTIWVHLDWHSAHYVKVFMDQIFGVDNFVNEIVWHYKSGGSGKRHFARKHDTILVYSKSKKYYLNPPKEKSYNRGFKPYRFKGVKEYEDDMGWYTMVTMKDVWTIDMVGRTSGERTGYATQKPVALLQRIIESATEEGDLCADFFSGSGTLAVAAQSMGRRWICCDESPLAVSSALKRLKPERIKVVEENSLAELGKKNVHSCSWDNIKASASCRQLTASDKELVTVTIEDYRLPVALQYIDELDEAGRSTIGQVQEESPLSLLESWSVDLSYDGQVYRPSVFYHREKGILPLNGEWLRPAGKMQRKICIKTVDVLGNLSKRILYI